jgi:kynurenine formamidase
MPAKIIDLTQLLNDRITVYPDTVPPRFEISNSIGKDGYNETMISMLSHTGTHIDAPHHVLRNGKPLDQFTIDKFTGKAMVIPCQNERELSLGFLQAFESGIREVDFILFFTGWQDKWNTDAYFESCPIPTNEAAGWLADFRLKGIGIDAFSVDRIVPAIVVNEGTLPNHYIFLRKDILLIENLTSLDQLPDGGFIFQCFPLKLENADGSPTRAIAIIED